MFKFESGKECSFSINGHAFKTVAASKLKDQGTIQETDITVARFLQTLDNDGDPDNGIVITETVANAIAKVPSSVADFTTLDAQLAMVDSYEGKSVSIQEAREHLDKSIAIVTANATASATSIKEGDAITLSASTSTISRGTISSYEWTEGGARLSTSESFTKNDFSLGNHTLTLTIKDATGVEATDTITFTVTSAAPATIWDGVAALSESADHKLYVTSDTDKIYIKLEGENLDNFQFFIDSDNSRVSGLQTGTYGENGLDYVIKNDGLYKLIHQNDFSTQLVQAMSYESLDGAIEVVVDRTKFDYLAAEFGVMAFYPTDTTKNLPVSGAITNFTDAHFDTGQKDNVAPVITITGANPLVLNVGDTYSESGASAMDIIEGAVTASVRSSDVDTATAGFYTVVYTATDGTNEANASRIVEVQGASSQSTLEVKNMGALSESVVINHQTGLVWVNDNTKAAESQAETRGCIIIGEEVAYTDLEGMLKGYCENSDYAGFTDWRVPTSLEMSKFTVQMKQEGKTPGMARSGCTRALSIDDNTTVKAVWTHNLNQPGLIETGTLTPSGGRCVRGPVDTSTGNFSIREIGTEKDRVIVDTSKNLAWVNENNVSKYACLAIHFDKPEEYNTSKTFCSQLDHAGIGAGFWRDPTSAELSDFVKDTTAAHLLPGYEAPCKRLLARDADGEKAISTRFDTVKPLGEVSVLEQPLTSNIGLRCVTDATNLP